MPAIVLVIGLAVLAWGGYAYLQDGATLENNVEVTAEVTATGIEEVTALRNRERYVPTVTFEYTVGERVTAHVDPAAPGRPSRWTTGRDGRRDTSHPADCGSPSCGPGPTISPDRPDGRC